jgi:hypothetical protein
MFIHAYIVSLIKVQARSLAPYHTIDLWAFEIPTTFQVIIYYTALTLID